LDDCVVEEKKEEEGEEEELLVVSFCKCDRMAENSTRRGLIYSVVDDYGPQGMIPTPRSHSSNHTEIQPLLTNQIAIVFHPPIN
jgi:hypothetical protein